MKPMQSNNLADNQRVIADNQRVIVWVRTRPPLTESSPLIALDLDNNVCFNRI